MQNFDKQRDIMVERDLKGRDIHNPAVLEAMRNVPREDFVPEAMVESAYQDSPLPIGQGQTISQPYIVAAMTELLEPTKDDRILEVGTGSGYGAAILSRVAAEVYSVERLKSLADAARERFRRLGCHNIHVLHGDGSVGWPEHAPYDGIVITAGAPDVPHPLKEQLEIGGRLVIPTGSGLTQQLIRIRRWGEAEYDREKLFSVRFVPLVGTAGWN